MKINNQKTKRQSGFIFMILVVVIALISVVLLYLSKASSTMMFHTNRVYLQACERNLISSGLNWAQLNCIKENIENTNVLDVNDMNILHASLKVNITQQEEANEKYQAQISTSCSRADLNLASDETYTIKID